MMTPEYSITTLVTKRQAQNHQASDLHRSHKGDNRGMIKNRIKELRNERGWSLDKLAEKTNISKQHLNRLENYHKNARLNETNIAALCKAFGISTSELMGEPAKGGDSISQADMALTQIMQAVILILLKKGHLLPKEIDAILTQASDLYHVHHLANATRIVDQVRSSLTGEARTSEQEVIDKLLTLAPLGMA